MKNDLFEELLESVREAGRISRQEVAPARAFTFDAPDIKALRENTGLSQAKFALIIGIPIKTLQNWEQGRRKPKGPAVALLKVFKSDPEGAIKALHA